MAYDKIELIPGKNHATGTVVSVEEWQGNFGPAATVVLDTADGTFEVVLGGMTGVMRQVERLGFTSVQELTGGTYRFSKTPMKTDPTKGYLNIDKAPARGSAAPYGGPGHAEGRDLRGLGVLPTAAPQKYKTLEDLGLLYLDCARESLAIVGEVSIDTDGKFETTPETVAHSLFLGRILTGV